MKEYPSIQNSSKAPRQHCFAFVKYDGSNLRYEWSKKQGWHKFGTRHLLFDETSEHFGAAIPKFLEKYGDALPKVFKSEKAFRGVDRFIVYCEWFGAKSFAGAHEHEDPKDIILFDVNPLTKGMVGPKPFLDMFGHLNVAELVWQGNLGTEFIQKVRASDFDFIDFRSKFDIKTDVPEGVICKGTDCERHKGWSCKIKTDAYFAKLKERHPIDWEKLAQDDFTY